MYSVFVFRGRGGRSCVCVCVSLDLVWLPSRKTIIDRERKTKMRQMPQEQSLLRKALLACLGVLPIKQISLHHRYTYRYFSRQSMHPRHQAILMFKSIIVRDLYNTVCAERLEIKGVKERERKRGFRVVVSVLLIASQPKSLSFSLL